MVNTIGDYEDLISSEHEDKPDFMAMIDVVISPFVGLQAVLYGLIANFDIDTAVGVQLDAVGIWVGRSRFVQVPIPNVYFSWRATVALGWRAGVWRGKFDPTSGLYAMPDDLYRLVLKAKVQANSWDGSIPGAYAIYNALFTDNTVVIQDNQDMSFIIGIVGPTLSPIMLALLQGGYIPLKPEGVRIANYATTPTPGPFFAWDCNSVDMQGWGTGQWAIYNPPTT